MNQQLPKCELNETMQRITGEYFMPPFVIPPLVKWTLGAVGAGAAIVWVVKEVRRINAELDEVKPARVTEAVDARTFPTLRRDPRSGEYRL